ncbi:MAG: hypothetical protein K2X55_02300 [Burkholderiaceae bacterium]|nr:hypothetical protein [Burkholderiaceae bacterium]
MNEDLNSDLQDTHVPTLDQLRARLLPPTGHENDVIVMVNGHRVWKARADLARGEAFIPFFGGDYSAVLEPGDPLLKVPHIEPKGIVWPST